MGRGSKIALLVAACLVVVAALAWLNRPHDEPTKATVDDAVLSFRAEKDAGNRRVGQGEPALGVYRYTTQGSESVKGAAFAATHDYGGISTIVLSAGKCSERERWQVLAGRWTETEACAMPHGKTLTTVVEFHEFFDTPQEDSLRCHGPSGPPHPRPGTRYASLCKSRDSSISTAARLVGTTRVAVGSRSYDAVHIASRSVLEGKTTGTATREEWRRRSDGLLLRRSAESDADTSAGEGSHYSERYTIRLLSTKPRR
jgi:hypothetical protein